MLRIENIKKSFDKKEILKGISFDVKDGEIAALIGRNAVETEISRRFQFGINQGVGDTPDL